MRRIINSPGKNYLSLVIIMINDGFSFVVGRKRHVKRLKVLKDICSRGMREMPATTSSSEKSGI